jgi:polyphosphate kinase
MTRRYFNRDLSWLSFNQRVLQEASNKQVPLYERMKFLAIYSSNLEEFYRIRVAEWKRLATLTKRTKKELPENPLEVLKKIQKVVRLQQQEFDMIFRHQIIKDLAANNIMLLTEKTLSADQQKFVRNFFRNQVQPLIKPLALKTKGSMPVLDEKSIYLAVKLCDYDRPGPRKFEYALTEIPSRKINRFVVLPDDDGKHYVMILGDVIRLCIQEIFPDYELVEAYSIKLTRDADLILEDEFSGSLLKKIKKGITERSKGIPTRLLYDRSMPADFLKHIRKVFSIGSMDLMPGGRYHNISDLLNFPVFEKKGMFDEKLPCLKFTVGNMLEAISKRDILLHFPFQCYDPVIQFLQESAADPDVHSIKITLYRVASSSKIISALLHALENGKSVTAFIELKARFDEQSNIEYARELEAAGATVLYSFPILKVHAKMICVERREQDRMRRYAFLGTGNFNESTANTYVDSGLFTKEKYLCREVASVFDILKDTRVKKEFRHLLVAPDHMRHDLITLIDQEIKNALKGKSAYILLKLNSLQDQRMIDKLYEASAEGVKVKLIIRGICCLVPGRKGLSENIHVISIVDRYLEHSRAYVFCNDNNPLVYFSSADWMERNLSRRFEVAFPILDPQLRQEVIDILNIQWKDNVKARTINKIQNNSFRKSKSPIKVRSQVEIYKYLKSKLQSDLTE